MSATERLTIALPADVAAEVEAAVTAGDYASPSALVNEALQQWRTRRTAQAQDLAALKADIQVGMAHLVAGRVVEFDANRIIERGKALSPNRSRSG